MRKVNDGEIRTLWRESHVFDDPGAPAQVLRVSPQSATVSHQHEFTELVFIVAGRGMHVMNATRYELAAGDCFVIEAGGSHAYQNTDRLEVINVVIRQDAMKRLRRVTGKLTGYPKLVASPPTAGGDWTNPRRLTPHELADCLRIVEQIETESKRGAAGWYDMQEALLQELFIVTCRYAAIPAGKAPAPRARIEALIRHLERNYADPVTATHIGTIACMSERTVQRHFRKATGVAPLHYLLRVRIAHAARMVRETDLSITDIGGQCGIPNSAYFARLFRRFTGASPSAYRRKARPQTAPRRSYATQKR